MHQRPVISKGPTIKVLMKLIWSPLQVSQRTVTKQNPAFFIFNYLKLKRGREKGSLKGEEPELRICLVNQ